VGGRRCRHAAAARSLAPAREAVPTACWQDERLTCGSREGVVSFVANMASYAISSEFDFGDS
jgi:hypothetical protein